MKRALIVLLLLAVAGGLFAQSVVFSGHARSGLMVAIEDDTTFHVYNPDPGQQVRFELNVAATRADGNAGASGRLRYLRNEDANSVVGEWGYAWLKPMDTLTLYGGKMDNNNWGTMGGFDADGGVGSQTGILIRFDPVAGVSLGASASPLGLEIGKADYRFGLKYTMTGLFAAAANLGYNGNTEVTNVNAGFDFLGLSGLGLSKLALDLQANNLSDLAWLGIGPRVHFAFGDFSGGVRARVFLPMGESTEDLDAAATLWGQIPFGTITARLGVGYELNAAVASTNGARFDYREWDALPKAIGGAADESLLIVRPSLTFNIGGGSLEAGFSMLTNVGGESKSKSAIFANFSVGF